MAPVAEQLTELVKRQYGYNCGNGYYPDRYGNCYRNRSSNWNNWGRWVALVLIVLFFVFVFFLLSCTNARRRRKRGLNPYRGTGWAATAMPFGNNKNNHNNSQNAYAMNNNPNNNYQTTGVAGAEPVPPYSPPHNAPMNNYNQNDGYYGGQQSGVEVQQPQSAYHPGTGGSNVYQPPSGPPPGKGTYGSDGVIR